MFSKNPNSWHQTVTFRLTFTYIFLAITLSSVAFAIFYVYLDRILTANVDRFLAIELEELETFYRRHSLDELNPWIIEEAEGEGVNRVFIRVLAADGTVIGTSDLRFWEGVESLPSEVSNLSIGSSVFRTLSISSRRYPVRTILKKIDAQHILQFSIALQETEILKERFRELFAVIVLMLTICGGVAGWFVIRRAMSGVERVTDTAEKINKEDLRHRVPQGNEGLEIKRLANAVNNMLERVQHLVGELKDVTNNIAHDLRTPITRIRGIAETTLTGSNDLVDYRKMAGSVIEECDGLEGLIDTMLDIAEIESGVAPGTNNNLDFREIVAKASEIFAPVAEDSGISMTFDTIEEPVILNANKQQMERVVANLIDNALKFTPAGGNVLLKLGNTSGRVTLTVRDSGIGIGPNDLPHIAKKFYRAERSRSTPGHGLGLSLVKSIVTAYGGKVTVESEQGEGTTVRVSFP